MCWVKVTGPVLCDAFARYALMGVQFSTADWVLSLGLGAEVPRTREQLDCSSMFGFGEPEQLTKTLPLSFHYNIIPHPKALFF